MKTIALGFSLITGVALIPLSAQVVFNDNFDAGTSAASWTARLSHADAFADFAYNYSDIGVPSAPHSTGGSTTGMRFLVNQSAGVFQGISATPNNLHFTGDFRLTFDLWYNYAGPLGPGGNGTTQLGSYGWGVSGSSAEWAGASSGVMFAASLDGGTTSDYRLYRSGTHVTTTSTYAAGSQNNSAAYYTALFAGQTAPAAQTTAYPGQTGTTDAGEISFKWYEVTILKGGDNLAWYVDGNLIASTSLTGVPLSGDNIFLGMFDSNAGSSSEVNDFLNTAIYDNIVVTVPEPSAFVLATLGGLVLLTLRRRD